MKKKSNPEHQRIVDHLISAGFRRESRDVYTMNTITVQIMDDRRLSWKILTMDHEDTLSSDLDEIIIFKT